MALPERPVYLEAEELAVLPVWATVALITRTLRRTDLRHEGNWVRSKPQLKALLNVISEAEKTATEGGFRTSEKAFDWQADALSALANLVDGIGFGTKRAFRIDSTRSWEFVRKAIAFDRLSILNVHDDSGLYVARCLNDNGIEASAPDIMRPQSFSSVFENIDRLSEEQFWNVVNDVEVMARREGTTNFWQFAERVLVDAISGERDQHLVLKGMWADFHLLKEFHRDQQWTNASPVNPDWLGPIWPEGKPQHLVGNGESDQTTTPPVLQIEFAIPAGLTGDCRSEFGGRVAELYAELSRAHVLMGGTGLRILDETSCQTEESEKNAPVDPAPTASGEDVSRASESLVIGGCP